MPIESELGFTRPGPYIYEFLAEIKITYETVSMLIDTIDQATALLEDGKLLIAMCLSSICCSRLTLRRCIHVDFS